MNDLKKEYEIKIEDKHYQVIHTTSLSCNTHAICNPHLQIVIFNDSFATVFDYVHEYKHIELNHYGRLQDFNGNDERNPHEREANLAALKELAEYHISQEYVLNINSFLDWYGIPYSLELQAKTILKEVYISANPSLPI